MAGALLFATASLAGCTSTYAGRWVVWNRSDIEDHRRFPALEVRTDRPVFHFAPASPRPLEIEIEHRGRLHGFTLAELAHRTRTPALFVVQRDSLLFEGYANGYDRASVNTSFSVAKAVTSLLVGIAFDRGWLGSLDDAITAYLPELARRDTRFTRVKLAHLLDMRSGLRWRDHDFITGDKPRAYYHPQLRRLLLEEIPLLAEPGERWQYNSYNPILLGLILERATGRNPAELLEEWLGRPLGMEFPASWSVDGTREPMVKMESGINARAIDFARLGRLVLARGRWGDEQVVSAQWIDESTRALPGCALEAFRPREVCYRHGWWIYPASDSTGFAFAATGHLGQYIYVVPGLELIIVRFGRNHGGVSWPAVFRAIAARLASGEPDPSR